MNIKHLSLVPLTFISLVTAIMFVPTEASRHYKGGSFSDPSKKVEMPLEWHNQGISHDGVVINLDQQIYFILKDRLKEYAEKHNIKISMTDSTCGNSSGLLRHKMIDIGGFCCPPGELDRLPGIRFHTSGITPVALIVHPDNPVQQITFDQARDIFMGKITRWSELRTPDGKEGPDQEIQPVGRLHCKTRPGHWRLLLDNENMFSLDMSEVGSIPDMIARVASNPYAIGHVAPWFATDFYRDRGEVNFLSIDGHSPKDLDALLKGRYPVYKSFFITTWEGDNVLNPDADHIARFILDQVEKLDSSYNIIPASRLRESGWEFRDTELTGDLLLH